MLKEHDFAFRQLFVILDFVIVTVAFFIAYFVRDEMLPLKGIYPLESYLNLLPVVGFLWIVCLNGVDAYRPLRGRSIYSVFLDIIKAGIAAMIFFAAYAYLLRLYYVSRIFILCVFSVTAIILVAERLLVLWIFRTLRKKGYNYNYMLIIGTGRRAQNFISIIHKHPEWGFRIIGLVDDDLDLVGKKVMGHKILGTLKDIPDILDEKIVDEIIFVIPRAWLSRVEEAISYCEKVGRRVSVAVDLFTMAHAKIRQTDIYQFPLLSFQTTSDKVLQLSFKRILDIVVAGSMLLILSPFLLTIILMVKLSSKGPVFFKQTRCSLNGRLFTIYKFRTMVADAESRLESLRHHNEMQGPVFKMTRDPRITPLGKWMRKFSIDEFPQLINILKGDMSIVGPRPPIPQEVKIYEPWQRRRLSMRPGLTCLWQIKGRNKIVKFEEWMNLDLQYIDRWSLWLDLQIFLKTIPIVLFGIGAK